MTLAEATTLRTAYLNALTAVLANQSYTIAGPDGSRTFTKANLKEIQAGFTQYDSLVNLLSQGRTGARIRQAIPY
jgi:hypothetical protein